jgi:hypothetical protein
MDKRLFAGLIWAISFNSVGAIASDKDSTQFVSGADINAFMDSGAVVNPMDMERASIQADNFVSMPPGHNIRQPKPGNRSKKNKFARGVGRAFAHTANFVGFPVGDDKDVDASLSSDLRNEENKMTQHQLEAAQQRATK